MKLDSNLVKGLPADFRSRPINIDNRNKDGISPDGLDLSGVNKTNDLNRMSDYIKEYQAKEASRNSDNKGVSTVPTDFVQTREEFKQNNDILWARDLVHVRPGVDYNGPFTAEVIDVNKDGMASDKIRRIETSTDWNGVRVSTEIYHHMEYIEPGIDKNTWKELSDYASKNKIDIITADNFKDIPIYKLGYTKDEMGFSHGDKLEDKTMSWLTNKVLPDQKDVKWAIDVPKHKLILYKEGPPAESKPERDNSYEVKITTLEDLEKDHRILSKTKIVKDDLRSHGFSDSVPLSVIDINNNQQADVQSYYLLKKFLDKDVHLEEPAITPDVWDKVVAYGKEHNVELITSTDFPDSLDCAQYGYYKSNIFKSPELTKEDMPFSSFVEKLIPKSHEATVYNKESVKWAIDLKNGDFITYNAKEVKPQYMLPEDF